MSVHVRVECRFLASSQVVFSLLRMVFFGPLGGKHAYLQWLPCLIWAAFSSHALLRCLSGLGHSSSRRQLCSVGDLLLFPMALRRLCKPTSRRSVSSCCEGWVTFTSASAGAPRTGVRRLRVSVQQLCRESVRLSGLYRNNENIRPCDRWYRLEHTGSVCLFSAMLKNGKRGEIYELPLSWFPHCSSIVMVTLSGALLSVPPSL